MRLPINGNVQDLDRQKRKGCAIFTGRGEFNHVLLGLFSAEFCKAGRAAGFDTRCIGKGWDCAEEQCLTYILAFFVLRYIVNQLGVYYN